MDKARDVAMAARYEGRPTAKRETVKPVSNQEKEYLLPIVKILRLRKAGESGEWVIRNLGENLRLVATICDICEKKPDASAR